MSEEDYSQNDEARFQPGSRLGVPEKLKGAADRLTPRGRNIRSSVDNALKNFPVAPANDNITTATVVGAVGTYVVRSFETYAPGDVAASADIASADVQGDSVVYTVDSNAVIESQARFRAILDAGTGLTSLYTDGIEVESMELVNERPARDTYRYKIRITF